MNNRANVPLGLRGDRLTEADYRSLAARWIDREYADKAFLRRVDSLTGAEEMGCDHPQGDYAGLVIPYIWPGKNEVREVRLRRDHPAYEVRTDGTRKPTKRYVTPGGRRNMLYFPIGVTPELLCDTSIPIVVVEGEFKAISLWRLAWYGRGDAAEQPMFLPIGLSGVWNWRGKIGKHTDETGTRVDEVGAIPDLQQLSWPDRQVTILFDPDVSVNVSVAYARDRLTSDLIDRGTLPHWWEWPKKLAESINGIDDYLAAVGPDEVLRRLVAAKPRYKRRNHVSPVSTQGSDGAASQLILNESGVLRPIVTNAIVLLQHSPEWHGVLAYDEFAMRIVILRPTPWGSKPEIWTAHDDSRVQEWLQRAGLFVGLDISIQGLEHVAKLRPVHPVREYLDGLSWDGQERLHTWLSNYLGVEDTPYVRASERNG